MVNTHGLMIKGLVEACKDTHNYRDDTCYNEIFYDLNDGSVWCDYHCSLGHNFWTEYRSNSIIKVCSTRRHLTEQDIADEIFRAVTERRQMMDYIADRWQEAKTIKAVSE